MKRIDKKRVNQRRTWWISGEKNEVEKRGEERNERISEDLSTVL